MKELERIEHVYQPEWIWRSYLQFFNLLAPVILLIWPLFLFRDHGPQISIREVLGAFVSAIFGCIGCLVTSTFFSEIISDNDGLHVTFLWKSLTVRWDEIVDIRPIFHIPFAKVFVIRTNALTPFHRIMGLLYSFTFMPCLIFSKSISDYPELSKRIRMNLRKLEI